MPNPQDHRATDVETGEVTPLLAKDSHRSNDKQYAASSSLGAGGATAPPPAAAPPPPPPPSKPGQDSKNDVKKNENESSASLSSANSDDDVNLSSSQLSVTRSTKSGKSGKSNSKRKKKKGTEDASTKSGKNAKAKKKRKPGPQKSMCHLLFDSVRYLAIIASSMMFMMQFVPLIFFGDQSTWLQIAVRSYVSIFCVSFMLNESRLPIFEKILTPRNNWILRGFLYSFIGLIGMEQDLAVRVEDIAAGTTSVLGPNYGTLFATLFMSITTWVMIGVGILYTVLGLLCLQGWYERLEKDHTKKAKEWKQKKKVEKNFKKQKEDQEKYEKDRQEGRGEWYDDLE